MTDSIKHPSCEHWCPRAKEMAQDHVSFAQDLVKSDTLVEKLHLELRNLENKQEEYKKLLGEVLANLDYDQSWLDTNHSLDLLVRETIRALHEENRARDRALLEVAELKSHLKPEINAKVELNLADVKVSYENSPHKRTAVFNRLIEFYVTHGAFCGDSVVQNDDPSIEAVDVLAEIVDDIIKFELCDYEEK